MASKEKPLYTIDDEIADLQMKRPHVVILGAGASIAATPNGDAFGRRLPSMMTFVDVLGLQPILAEHGISFVAGTNFETLYAGLAEDSEKQAIARQLERAVSNYFGSLRLPPHATLYDRLVLSLRSKDLIATFNWDPFLYQACYATKTSAIYRMSSTFTAGWRRPTASSTGKKVRPTRVALSAKSRSHPPNFSFQSNRKITRRMCSLAPSGEPFKTI
jgi:hypothetical protein